MTPAGREGGAAIAFVSIFMCPAIAEAHSPIEGLGTFYAQLLHPVVVPSHTLLLVATALLLGQQGRSGARAGVVALGLTFIAGFLAATTGAISGVRENILLLGALALGGLMGLDLRIPSAVTAAAGALTGLAIGLDSATNNSGLREAALGLVGVTIGVMYLTVIISGAAVGLVAHWQRVGIRIAGAWIAAISLMVLALSVATPVKRATAAFAHPLDLASPC
jgi:hypothetical protein